MSNSTRTRRIFQIDLEPTAGSRFQPTGFPDVDAAEFERVGDDGEWERAVVVESSQSMANHLEAAGWDDSAQQPVPAFEGLPYVRVLNGDVADADNSFLTSSRLESHRLASAYIKDALHPDGRFMTHYMADEFKLFERGRMSPGELAREVMKLDPLCVLHGVFFAEKEDLWPGQPRLARAISGFVEAIDVRPVVFGGLRRDEVWQSLADKPSVGAGQGYNHVPFHKTEYTAKQIVASLVLDVDLIRSYHLGDAATELLTAIAEWEIASLFEGGFRPRTACDLQIKGDNGIRDRDGESLASIPELEERIRKAIVSCGELLGDGQPLQVRWSKEQAGKGRTKR